MFLNCWIFVCILLMALFTKIQPYSFPALFLYILHTYGCGFIFFKQVCSKLHLDHLSNGIMAAIHIGNLQLKRNLIQGGMGVISTAQVGCDDLEFRQHPEETNLRVLPNITAVGVGRDAIISGAGLPTGLPRDTGDSCVKRSGGVSSERTAAILLKRWDAKFARTADFIVMEAPTPAGIRGIKRNSSPTWQGLPGHSTGSQETGGSPCASTRRSTASPSPSSWAAA